MNDLVTDQDFDGKRFLELPPSSDFENCNFKNCVFAKAKVFNLNFSNCTFENCDLSGVYLIKTGLQDCVFEDCKMLGIAFESCDPFLFQIQCERCILDFSSFYKVDLRASDFQNCQLKEVDFAEANLSGIALSACNLIGASFKQTNLQKTDFTTAVQYNLKPDANKIAGAIFCKDGLAGLLASYKIKIV